MKKFFVIALLCAMVTGAAFAAGGAQQGQAAAADNYPSKPVTAMVAWAPGGGGDLVFRALAEVFPKYSNGQPMVIVNKGEAAGVPGIMDFKQNAKPEGYDIMHWNPAHVIKTHMDPVPFTGSEFPAVCQIVLSNNFLAVKTEAKWQTLQEYIADAKANPGQISVGNAGAGGGNHFGALMFEKIAGIQLKHIPFSGGGPAITGLLTGDCQSTMANPPEGAPNVLAGQLRVLASFGDKRNAAFPNVPTGKELGVDFSLNHWRGVVTVAGTPPAIIEKLQNILKKCIEDPVFVQRMESLGSVPAYTDAKTYGAQIAADDKLYEGIIKENKMGNRYK
jgi:tripartite-type tricarboxylate transporter receptor subunit TctC